MGNTSSSGRPHDDTVDYGALVPQGVYTGPRDWNHQVVAQAIAERRLAPFYRPLEDFEEDWNDEQILAARKEPPPPPEEEGAGPSVYGHGHSAQGSMSGRHHHGKKASTAGKGKDKDLAAAAAALNEASLYRGAAECPICFLYYPPNINYSRCCSQAICTECFVQIKRAEPDAQHLESEPAACPYCVRSDFGVVYKPPPWRAGIGSDGHIPPSPGAVQAPVSPPGEIRRRQSFGANDPQVVTTDQIRPDWEAKLEAVKAAVARRAARRIIMRQVGDRLIPVGISSGRVQIMPGPGGSGEEGGGGGQEDRRQRRRDRDISRMLGIPGFNSTDYPGGVIATQDLEELMIMEAMRQSMLEEEERQRKEKEKEKKKGESSTPSDGAGPSGSGSGAIPASPIDGPSVSSSAPQSALHLPAVTGSSLLPPPATEPRGRASGHQSSHSQSTSSGALTPASGGSGSMRARSQPPFSALSVALRGAAHAASAIGVSSSRRREGTGTSGSVQGSGANTPVSPPPPAANTTPPATASTREMNVPPPPAPVPIPTPPADRASKKPDILTPPALTSTSPNLSVSIPEERGTFTAPSSSAAPPSSSDIPDTAAMGLFSPRPAAPGHNDSFASSIVSDASNTTVTYDVLGSDEEREGEDEEDEAPLLSGEAPLPVGTPGTEIPPVSPGLDGGMEGEILGGMRREVQN